MFKFKLLQSCIISAALFHFPTFAKDTNKDFYVKKGITLLSGDAWIQEDAKYQLYGVQSCLRGTNFTDKSNQQIDCGVSSMKILASFFNDVPTICRPILSSNSTVYVDCKVQVKDQIVDLGTALISIGFHFASRSVKENNPINITYYAAEKHAFENKAGLWAYDNFPHPVEILKNQRNQSE